MLRVSRQSIDVLGQKSSDLRVATQAVDVIGTTDPYLRVYRVEVEYLRLAATGGTTHEVGATSSLSFSQTLSSNIVGLSATSTVTTTQTASYTQTTGAQLGESNLTVSQAASAAVTRVVPATEFFAIGSAASYIGPKFASAASMLVLDQSTRFPQASELAAESEVVLAQTAVAGGTKRLSADTALEIDDIADNIIKLRAASTQIDFSQATAVEKIITVESHLVLSQEVILGAVDMSAETNLELVQSARFEPFPQSATTQLDISQSTHQNIRNVAASSVVVISQSEISQKPIRASASSTLLEQDWLLNDDGTVTLQNTGLRGEATVTHTGNVGANSALSFDLDAEPWHVRANGTSVSATSSVSFTLTAREVETGEGSTALGLSQQADALVGRPGDNQLTLSQEATVNLSQGLTAENALAISQASTYTVTSLMSVNQYSPFVGESSDANAPTPPSRTIDGPMAGIQVPFQLVYPAVGTVTDSVSLRAPDLGNMDRLAFNRIQRETRGGTLVIFADPDWPKIQTLVLSFSGLSSVEAHNLLTFEKNHLGQEIGLIDWEHRYWKGVIVTPDKPVTEDSPNSFSAGFEFQGELDSSQNPQVVPPPLL